MGLVPASEVMGLPMIVGAHTQDEVQLALDWASASVESYCEREFAYNASDTVVVDPYYSHVKAMPSIAPMTAYGSYPGYGVAFSAYGAPYIGTAMLPDPPVANVDLVEAWMPMTSGDTTGWVQLQNFMWAPDGLVWDTSGMPGVLETNTGPVPSWPRMPRSLQVTYSHGYTLPGAVAVQGVPTLPQGIVSAVIRGAALFLNNPVGTMESRVGEITERYMDPGMSPAGWLDEKILGQYRLVHL